MTDEWLPGTPHPTGGYDRVECDPRTGVPISYYLGARLHRLDGPACYIAGAEEWWVDGWRHREDGPSCVSRDEGTLVVTREIYHRQGKVHRIGGPAKILRNRWTGQPLLEEFVVNGQAHRLDGPAETTYSDSGEVVLEEFRIFGEWWSRENFALLREVLDSGAPLDWALAFVLGDSV